MEAYLYEVREYFPKGSYMISVSKDLNGDFKGRIYFPHSKRTAEFSSVWNMIKKMEEDIIKSRFPQFTFELRRWAKNSAANMPFDEEGAAPEELENEACTFNVQVRYCQGATWQGHIRWMEGKQSKSFRSNFEMVKLIEEALEYSNKNKEHN